MSRDGPSILLIDDSEDDCMLYRRALRSNPSVRYAVVEAHDGEEGLRCVAAAEPSCVLLDYSLPGHDGVEVLKRIRKDHPFLPVVMLTGQGNERVAVTAMQEGAQNYVAKASITAETLAHAIGMAMEHCALRRRIDDQRASLEVFTRALAHDLREPVRTVQSFADIVAHEELSAKGRECIEHVRHAARRMRTLIDVVFLYTRLDDPRQMARELVDATAAVQEARENLEQLVRERGAVVACGPLPRVHASRPQLVQVLQNLITNAIRHGGKAVTIDVSAEEQSDAWLFRVRDDGPGIDEAKLETIFVPFKRLAHDDETGTGLGLAICRKIVESHGGRMWCESRPGAGATFLFTLPKPPAAAVEAEASGAIAAAPMPADGGGDRPARVLLVDDNDADIALTRTFLLEEARLQCDFSVARSGREALATLYDRGCAVDLMLLDINMPEMDGFEVLEEMGRAPGPGRPVVVMCTGSTYDKDMERARDLGAAGYLVKPVTLEQLRTVIAETGSIGLYEEGGRCALRLRYASPGA